MITRVSELFERFLDEEQRKISEYNMPHMPTLGSAYEEITKQGVNQNYVIPKALDLHVVSGFIKINDEQQPQQIDCMLVKGNGERYGLTNQFIYDIGQILCIFEVKKTLNKNDFKDAMEHLASIKNKFSEFFENLRQQGNFEPKISHSRKVFARITGKMAPESFGDVNNMKSEEAMLFYALVQEENAPAIIIHGYGGYKEEKGLRKAFTDILEESLHKEEKKYGILSFPTLVTSNNFCLVKCNGHPYTMIKNNDEWVVTASTRSNPAKIIIEIIWAKIASYFNLSMPYGDDIITENLKDLIVAIPRIHDNTGGWHCRFEEYKENTLKRETELDWNPEIIGLPETDCMYAMMTNGGYLAIDTTLAEISEKYNQSPEQTIRNLLDTRIFAMTPDSSFMRPLSECTHILATDDGCAYVAIDRNRFDAWCKKNSIEPNYMNIIFID